MPKVLLLWKWIAVSDPVSKDGKGVHYSQNMFSLGMWALPWKLRWIRHRHLRQLHSVCGRKGIAHFAIHKERSAASAAAVDSAAQPKDYPLRHQARKHCLLPHLQQASLHRLWLFLNRWIALGLKDVRKLQRHSKLLHSRNIRLDDEGGRLRWPLLQRCLLPLCYHQIITSLLTRINIKRYRRLKYFKSPALVIFISL